MCPLSVALFERFTVCSAKMAEPIDGKASNRLRYTLSVMYLPSCCCCCCCGCCMLPRLPDWLPSTRSWSVYCYKISFKVYAPTARLPHLLFLHAPAAAAVCNTSSRKWPESPDICPLSGRRPLPRRKPPSPTDICPWLGLRFRVKGLITAHELNWSGHRDPITRHVSASDPFSRFSALYKFVCMYVRMYASMYVHWSRASASRIYVVSIGCSETRTVSARLVLSTVEFANSNYTSVQFRSCAVNKCIHKLRVKWRHRVCVHDTIAILWV